MNGMPSFANPANLERSIDPEAIELPPDASPIDFLQAVYRSPTQPMHRRLKAAIEAAEFLHPRLSVSAFVDGGDFAERLERATVRSRKVIEAEPIRALHEPTLTKTMVSDP